MSGPNTDKRNFDPSTGQFIDPLFAVIIAAGVTKTLVTWVDTGAVPDTFSCAIILLGFVNLLLSWFGYHKSVFTTPIKGGLRFIITVTLLPLYLLTIIVHSKGFHAVMTVYSAVFFLWTLWEYLKSIEYGAGKSFFKLQFRLFNLIVYIPTLYCWSIVIFSDKLPGWIDFQYREGIFLGLLTLAILLLRVSKSTDLKGSSYNIILTEIKVLCFGGDAKDA